MKKFFYSTLLVCGLFLIAGTGSSCNRKSGCPAYEKVHAKTKKGQLTNKKGSSNLFPKKMRKKLK